MLIFYNLTQIMPIVGENYILEELVLVFIVNINEHNFCLCYV